MTDPVYILGGWQSDFSQRAGDGLYPLLEAATRGALEAAALPADALEVAHVANTAGELFCFQGQLGGMVASIDPAFAGLPTGRHEAACASGSVAALGAMADLESNRYEVALVVGAEVLRNVPGQRAGELLQASMWSDREAVGDPFPWPKQFSEIANEYDRRYGVDTAHLARIAEINFENARANPNAQTRDWPTEPERFGADDEKNPLVHGMLRKGDCGRFADGSAAVILASPRFAREYASERGVDFSLLPRIKGWGHRTGPMQLETKFAASRDEQYVFPHMRKTMLETLERAGLSGAEELDALELHDCFTISEYTILDHFGLAEPGDVWKLIDDGSIERSGVLAVNPSGGLLGGGHPVGATGVRMLVDASKQVSGRAGETQVDGARNVMTFNIGGSFTTVASFIVGVDA